MSSIFDMTPNPRGRPPAVSFGVRRVIGSTGTDPGAGVSVPPGIGIKAKRIYARQAHVSSLSILEDGGWEISRPPRRRPTCADADPCLPTLAISFPRHFRTGRRFEVQGRYRRQIDGHILPRAVGFILQDQPLGSGRDREEQTALHGKLRANEGRQGELATNKLALDVIDDC